MNIVELFKKAKSSITVIGTLGVVKEIYSELSKNLDNYNNINILIFCESDNFLFNRSIFLDNSIANNRKSFTELKFNQRILTDKLNSKLLLENQKVLISYLDIPIKTIVIDNTNIFVSPQIGSTNLEYVSLEDFYYPASEINEYIKLFLDSNVGLKFSAPYKNNKGNVTETIELFDQDRVRRGIYPRSSFYNSDFWKLVVWVYIFDREGRILIHKRSENAKDNQGMWDKSVGGHMDYYEDIDTYKTVTREVIEELYTDENTDSKFIQIRDEDMIYMGDWKPNKRKDAPFEEISSYKEEWAYFRVPQYFQTSSPRLLKNGKIRNNNVIADVYLFVAGAELDENYLKKFENSPFLLAYPEVIKSAIARTTNDIEVDNFPSGEKMPKFTPDIRYAFNGKLRNTLEEFSHSIRFHFK